MSKSILNTYAGGGSTLTIEPADKANLVEVPTVQAGLSRETNYVYMGSNAEHPLIHRVGYYPNPGAKGGLGIVNISLRTTTVVYDDIAETYGEVPVTTAWTMPGNVGVLDPAGFALLLQNHISLILPAGADVLGIGALARLAFGVTGGLASLLDTA